MGQQINHQGTLLPRLEIEVEIANKQLVTANSKLKNILTGVITSCILSVSNSLLHIVSRTKQILHGYRLDLYSLGIMWDFI